MKKNEIKERIQKYVEAVEKSIKNFSNEMKSERERSICAAFLRCLGIDFQEEEIIPIPKREQCPDVRFRSAEFEVKEILDRGRKRHSEYKESLEKYKNAKIISDLGEDMKTRPKEISLTELNSIIMNFLKKYNNHYAQAVRESLDLLIYVNLHSLSLTSKSCLLDKTVFSGLGWRSISMVMDCWGPVAYSIGSVLNMSDSGPNFLRSFTCNIYHRENKGVLYRIRPWEQPA